MYEVRKKIRHASLLLVGLFWVFDVVTPNWVGDIARSLLVISALINIWGGAQSIKGFVTPKNVVNLQFASEVRPEVVGDISKSVLRNSRLHNWVTCLPGNILGTEMCIKVWEWGDFDYWRLLQQEWFESGRSRKRYGRVLWHHLTWQCNNKRQMMSGKSRWNFVKTKTTTPGSNIYTLLITFTAFSSFISSKFQTLYFPYKLSYYAWATCGLRFV